MPDMHRIIRITRTAVLLLMMAGIFLSLTQPIFSSDFWWHLATGRWMIENRSLMDEDPFNFMAFPEEPEARRSFTLKQYWLSQILMYLVYLAGGLKGIVVLRAAVLGMMFLVLYLMMRRAGAAWTVSVGLVFMAWWVILHEFSYIMARPQMFSSLFSVVLIFILEEIIGGSRRALYALPALMLLWANMHAGFALGVAVIIIYGAGFALRGGGGMPVYIALAAGVCLSLLNPNGYMAFYHLLMQYLAPGDTADILTSVTEQKSVFSYSGIGGVMRRLPVFSALLFFSAASFAFMLPAVRSIRRIRQVRVEILALYIMLLTMAVSAARYSVFFATLGAFILALNSRDALRGLWQRLSRLRHAETAGALLGIAAVILSTVPMASAGIRNTALTSENPYLDEPAGAADFLKRNGITGRMFNDYGQGGYLIWTMYPYAQVFMDGRGLYLKGYELGRLAVDNPFYREPGDYGSPLYEKLADRHAIDIAVLPGCDRISGVLIRLTLALLRDPRWHVVYADNSAIVLLRDTPRTHGFIRDNAIADRAGYVNILSMATAAGKGYYGNIMPGRRLSMAVAHAGLGDYRSARKWLNEYMMQVPRDPLAESLSAEINDGLRGTGKTSPLSR